MRIKEELSNLKENDIYSLMIFVLYKVRNIPDYAALSELAFILDKNSLLKLCEYYGGLTLKIPTIQELESIVNALTLYQLVDIENMDYDSAVDIIGCPSNEKRQLKSDYQKVKDVMQSYNFSSRQ